MISFIRSLFAFLWVLCVSTMVFPVYAIGWARRVRDATYAISPSRLWWWIPPFWHHLIWWLSYKLFLRAKHEHIGEMPQPHTGEQIMFLPSYHMSEVGFIPYYWFIEHAFSWRVLVSIKQKGVKRFYKWVVHDSLVALGLIFVFRRNERKETLRRLSERLTHLRRWPGVFQVFLNSRPLPKYIDETHEMLGRKYLHEDFSWLIAPLPKVGGFLQTVDALPEGSRICFVFSSFDRQYHGFRHLPKAVGGTFYTMTRELTREEIAWLQPHAEESNTDRHDRVGQWLLHDVWKPWCETIGPIWSRP